LLLAASDYVYQWTPEGDQEALRLFYKAIELDPDYAQAYAFATHCRISRGLSTEVERRELATLAREAIRLGKDDAFSLCWAGFSLACQQRSDFGVNSPVLFCDHIASPSRSIGRSETVKNAGGSPNISDRTRRCVG